MHWTGVCAGIAHAHSLQDEYYYKMEGLQSVLVDYYVRATDVHGNVKKSDIYHVWVGTNP